MQMGETIDKMRRRMPQPETIRRAGGRVARVLRKLSPKHLFGRLDWYIIRKFIGTYIFSIVLIISIALVFDFNENLSKFTKYHAPWRAIVFDYYANFIPYYSNLFSPLFVFIAVIFFTSKLAGNSEIIAMLSSGVSFRRLMRPYMISCVLIASVTFYLNSFVIPHGTVIRQNFESLYRNSKKNTSAENVQLQVGKGTVAYIQHYDDRYKRGYGFSLDKFEGKKLVSHMTAMEIQYDTIADAKYHWKATNWKTRTLVGLRERIVTGDVKDTVILMEPTDLVYSKGQQETFTSPELLDYISKQTSRGSGNVVQYEVPQAHRHVLLLLHPHHHRTLALGAKAKGRNGPLSGYRPGPELRLHHAPDRLLDLCHQCRHAPRAGRMDSEPYLCLHSLFLL